MMNKALFLDRDGVININYGYVHIKENFEFIEGIFDLVREARAANYLVFVVTNQAGIGRGYYSEEQFHELTAWMCREFDRHQASIDKVYYSPFHPTQGLGKFLKDESTRKPGPGMLLAAQQEFCLSLADSILVGDKVSDIQAGVAAGVGTNILLSATSCLELTKVEHVVVKNLDDVTRHFVAEGLGFDFCFNRNGRLNGKN